MKSQTVSVKWVTPSSRTRIRENFLSFFRNIDTFINKLKHSITLSVKGYIKERDLVSRTKSFMFWFCLNVLGTGLVIHYIITHDNFIKYGLLSAIVLYYVEWLIVTIKKPYTDEEKS